MPLVEFNGDTWEEDVVPDVVHVEMKNVLVPGKNKPVLTTTNYMDVPTSQKTQMTSEMDSTDEESDDSSLSHVDTVPTKKRHAVFRCLMQVLFPLKRTTTTEEFFASFRVRRQQQKDDDSERSTNSMSDISILALPEMDEPSKKQEERSKRKLFRGRRIARSRKVRGWTDSVVVKEELSGSCRAGLAPLGEEEDDAF